MSTDATAGRITRGAGRRPRALRPATWPGAGCWDMTRSDGRAYRIFIQEPEGPPPAAGYPVLFLTDGNWLFPLVAPMLPMRTQMRELRPALLVAIGYATDDASAPGRLRAFDLTPPTPNDYAAAPGAVGPYGGADALLDFILGKVLDRLARRFPVDRGDLSLMGDSLGGLHVLHALFTRPERFRSFVAASPSIWWNDRAVLAGEAAFTARARAGEVSPRVLVTVGGLEQSLNPPPQMPGLSAVKAAALIREARMVDNARELGERLMALSEETRVEARFVAFPDETHQSVIPANLSRGVTFALSPSTEQTMRPGIDPA